MHDLKDVTNNVHYENFRYNNLATVTSEGQKTKPVTTSKYVRKLFMEAVIYCTSECNDVFTVTDACSAFLCHYICVVSFNDTEMELVC